MQFFHYLAIEKAEDARYKETLCKQIEGELNYINLL